MIERQGGQRILANTPATLSVTFFEDGIAADPGVVTVTITGLDETAIVTDGATDSGATGERSYDLTAAQTANLDVLTLTWTSASFGDVTTTAEIVGAHLFTVNEARALDNGAMSDTAKYPNAVIEQERIRIEDAFEERCGVSFIPRAAQVYLSGNGTTEIGLPLDTTAVRSVETRITTTWTAFDSDDLADAILEPSGRLTREARGVWPLGRRNVRIIYEHGHEFVPFEISRAGLKLLRATLVSSDIDPRATSFSDGLGTYRLITEGMRGAWFSHPEVNAILKEYIKKVPVIG